MFETRNCTLQENEDGTEETIIHIMQSNDATDKSGYPFGSRTFKGTAENIDAVLNGRVYKLPFGIRFVKS